jgi:acylphosphatase
VVIKGKVQGVYYRNWAVDTAQKLGVNGWVRNLKDGSVEAVVSGRSADVDAFVEKCHSGPAAARVSGVEVTPCKEEVPQGFEGKPTIW